MLTRIALLLLSASFVTAWVLPTSQTSRLYAAQVPFPSARSAVSPKNEDSARRAIVSSIVVVASTLLITTPAHALVKGNAPPANMKPSGEKPKCTNVEECQAMAERKQQEEKLELQGPPPKVTQGGTRYMDIDLGDESKSLVQVGDEVRIYYKVLKLGKRSYDGLSGEGTVVFSRGRK
jgi:hypothetical protein